MADTVGRLDAAMEARRLILDLEWQDVADRGGLSYETLRALRRSGRASALSKRRAEQGLAWKAGSIDAVLAGGTPTPIDAVLVPAGSGEESRAQLLRRLIAEAQDELRWLNPKYESTRTVIRERLERQIAELQRQLEALHNGDI